MSLLQEGEPGLSCGSPRQNTLEIGSDPGSHPIFEGPDPVWQGLLPSVSYCGRIRALYGAAHRRGTHDR